jgi:hypothetical protein
MVDLTVTLVIEGQLGHLAQLAPFLRDLRDAGVNFSLTLSDGNWSETYTNGEGLFSPFLEARDGRLP